MEGWKGRVEGWKDGRMEGWKGGWVVGWKARGKVEGTWTGGRHVDGWKARGRVEGTWTGGICGKKQYVVAYRYFKLKLAQN